MEAVVVVVVCGGGIKGGDRNGEKESNKEGGRVFLVRGEVLVISSLPN